MWTVIGVCAAFFVVCILVLLWRLVLLLAAFAVIVALSVAALGPIGGAILGVAGCVFLLGVIGACVE